MSRKRRTLKMQSTGADRKYTSRTREGGGGAIKRRKRKTKEKKEREG